MTVQRLSNDRVVLTQSYRECWNTSCHVELVEVGCCPFFTLYRLSWEASCFQEPVPCPSASASPLLCPLPWWLRSLEVKSVLQRAVRDSWL